MTVLESLPCSLPTGTLPADAFATADTIGAEFASKLSTLSTASLAKDAIWRDMFAVTGSLRTFYGADACLDKWQHYVGRAQPGSFNYKPGSGKVVAIGPTATWLECSYTFQAEAKPKRDCLAILSLVYDNEKGAWVIWVARTVLDQLSGHPNVDQYDVPEKKAEGAADQDQTEFECVVIGAGQAGLSVAGRLAAMGVSYVLLERNKAVGDNWRSRYESTKRKFSYLTIACMKLTWRLNSTHHPRVMYVGSCSSSPGRVLTSPEAHLPFDRTFPDSYPDYLPKNDLATGYSDWAKKYNIVRTPLLFHQSWTSYLPCATEYLARHLTAVRSMASGQPIVATRCRPRG